MINEKSISIRISMQDFEKIKNYTKVLGLNNSSFCRLAIFEYLNMDNIDDIEDYVYHSKKDKRINLVLNDYFFNILEKVKFDYGISVNDAVLYSVDKYLAYFSANKDFLKALEK